MDVEELETWYEEQKEKISEEYKRKVLKLEGNTKTEQDDGTDEEGKISRRKSYKQRNDKDIKWLAVQHEKLKRRFLSEMESLHKRYEGRSKKKIDFDLKGFFFMHKLEMAKSRVLKPFEGLKEKLQGKKKEEA